MIVYHGTDSESAHNIVNIGIDLTCGEDSVDNAQGFYATPSKEFASSRAKMMTAKKRGLHMGNNLKPVVIEIDIDLDVDGIHIKEFNGCDYEWKEFVFLNRMGARFLKHQKIMSTNHNLDIKYDVVIDETADAEIGQLVSQARYKETRKVQNFETIISKINRSSNPMWDKQISFHSVESIHRCIKSMRIVEL